MSMQEKKHQVLVWCTVAIAFLISCAVVWYHKRDTASFAKTCWEGQATIGNPDASVHVLVFEEFTCGDCIIWANEVFPKLYENYIKTGKIKYTMVPFAYLEGSKEPFIASRSIFKQGDEHYFAFVEYYFKQNASSQVRMSREEWAKAYADKHPEFDLEKCKESLASGETIAEIQKHNECGHKMMGDTIEVPYIMVNGKIVKDHSYENLSRVIDQAQEGGAK